MDEGSLRHQDCGGGNRGPAGQRIVYWACKRVKNTHQTIVALTSAFQVVAAFLAGTRASLSPVQVCLSHKNNYHLLHRSYVLGILNMLLLIPMTVLNRKCHSTNFTEAETQNLRLKVFATVVEPLIVITGL